MNMILHDFDADIRLGDSLRDPKFLTPDGRLETFDYVMANPPFSLDDWGFDQLKEADPYNRFVWGVPPKGVGDLAFVQHMLASLKPGGRAGIVMPHGVLFRSGAEKRIRQGMLEADLIEAVVGLPNKLFFGTGIPGCIVVLNKQKPLERKDKIIFIYGSNDYQEGKNQNSLRQPDIDKIIAAFKAFQNIEKYATVADLAQIAANDYNLNITRYVDVAEEQAHIDVAASLTKLQALEAERTEIETRLTNYLKELGYTR